MDWSNLKADYERLGTYTAVAAEYGVSRSRVAQEAVRQGVNPGNVWSPRRRAAHRAAIDRPEWRAKNRENMLKRLPAMRGPSANSPLEKLLQAALIKTGLSFSTQRVLLGRYCVDILIAQAPVIIEADGAFHHLRKEKDAERDAALAEAGYRVFRFDGSQINRDAMGCIASVVATAGLGTDAEPVADIRTGMMGPENPNWGGGPQPVSCAQCGARNERNAFQTQWKRTFCDAQCYGKWMSDHPEESNRKKDINWEDVAALYEDGASPDEIMQRFGIGKTTLYRKLRELGVQKRRSPKPPSKYGEEARANFRRGWEKRRAGGKAPVQDTASGRFLKPTS